MWSQNKISMLLLFLILLGQATIDHNREGLQFHLGNYLISIWTILVFIVSVAVYYKWAKKKTSIFAMIFLFGLSSTYRLL